MQHHDWSLTADRALDGNFDNPSAPLDDPMDFPEANVPEFVHQTPSDARGDGCPWQEPISSDDRGIDPGHHATAPEVHDLSADHVTTRSDQSNAPPVWQLHVDQLSVVSANEIDVNTSTRDEGSHHDLLSLATEAGWLDPKSPPMVFAGTVFAGAVGHRLKRIVGARTEELEGRVGRSEHVVVVVDADELARMCGRGDRLTDVHVIPGQGVQRPAEVVSMQTTNDEGATVVLNDRDGPLGRRALPLSVFEAAWKQSGYLAFTDADASSGAAPRLNEPRRTSERER